MSATYADAIRRILTEQEGNPRALTVTDLIAVLAAAEPGPYRLVNVGGGEQGWDGATDVHGRYGVIARFIDEDFARVFVAILNGGRAFT